MVSRPLSHTTAPPPKAMRLLDQAFHLLRLHPGALVVYMAGAMPFWLALLYFFSDMSRSAFAAQRCVAEALMLTCLFVLMKVSQSRFMATVFGIVSVADPPRWSLRDWLTVAVNQVIIQSTAFGVLVVSAIAMLPYAWGVAFYQNALLFGATPARSVREIVDTSWEQARLWPRQNHVAILALSGFGLMVFLQILIGIVFLPSLLRMFTGIETVFTLSPFSMFNTTVLTGAFALAFLVMDPVVKVFYVLRCFYGQSLHSGEDLRVSLHHLDPRRHGLGPALRLLLLLTTLATMVPGAVRAEDPIAPGELREAVKHTIDQPRYAWRMPRQPFDEEHAGPVERFFLGMQRMLSNGIDWVGDKLARLVRWLEDLLPDRRYSRPSAGSSWTWVPQVLTALGIVLVLLTATWAVVALWRSRQSQTPETIEAEAVPLPDLNDESVTADDLPTEDWLKLARELVAAGNLRLGLRAAYLSALALLADHQVLTIARYKSNLDYRRELARRAHQYPDLIDCFNISVRVFDRVWYGTHAVSDEAVTAFLNRLEHMRTHFDT